MNKNFEGYEQISKQELQILVDIHKEMKAGKKYTLDEVFD